MSVSPKKNIVIVRAGGNSLHNRFLELPYSERDYDVVVSYFDRKSYQNHRNEQGVQAFYCLGGKWDGLYETLTWIGEALDQYEFIWLPDDDIDADAPTINRLFAMMRIYNMAVAQPSLTADSYFTHFLFVNCPVLQVRFTNYVEIMVPCLSLDLLKAVLPHFRETMSGFGLDYIWCRLPQSGIDRCGIFDNTSVRHTRPVGKVLMGHLKAQGRSAKDEEAALNAHYSIKDRVTPLCYSAVMANGQRVHGIRKIGLTMFLSHMTRFRYLRREERSYGFAKVVQLLRRQLTRKMTMEPLCEAFVQD